MKKDQETFEFTNVGNQYYASITANLIMLGHGLVTGWLAPALDKLASDNTPLISGPLTNDEVSWIGSINCLGALCGTLSFGWFITMMGAKRSMLFLAIPSLTFWTLICFGKVYYHILLARFISGWAGGGIQTTIVLYISEIANDDIRGRLGSLWLFLRNIGILIAFILGATLEYEYIPFTGMILPIIFVFTFMMLPQTPQYLLKKGQFQKAEDALKFYRGYAGRSKEEENALYNEFEKLKTITNDRKTEHKIQATDFFNKNAMKGLGIGFALAISAQLTAQFTIISYSVMIFDKSGANVDPYISSIILAISLIFGSLVTTYLADLLGRKILNIISLIGSAIGLFFFSLYYYCNINGYDVSAFMWVPIGSLCSVIFLSSAGIVPLSFICTIEYLPIKIRTPGYVIICLLTSCLAFVNVKLFPILVELIDLHGAMISHGIGCTIGALFVIFVMNETTGLSLNEVGREEGHKMNRLHTIRVNSIS